MTPGEISKLVDAETAQSCPECGELSFCKVKFETRIVGQDQRQIVLERLCTNCGRFKGKPLVLVN